MSNVSPDEMHSDGGSSAGDTTPSSPLRSPPTDSESDFSDSPTDSLFNDEPFEPDLEGPAPGEEPQYRGRVAHKTWKAPDFFPPNNPPPPAPAHVPPPAPAPAPAHHHHHHHQHLVNHGVAAGTPLPDNPDNNNEE